MGQPTIGCAKSLLCGQHADPALERGSAASLVGGGQVIGAVVRTRANVKPVYVSVGHLISLSDAVEIVLNCASRVRLPEPLRAAHRMAKSGRPGYGQV